MAGSRTRSIVGRQWEIIVTLGSRRRGMTIQQLVDALGISRATIYRDLRNLMDVGVPIATERINGEARYSLSRESYPPLSPTSVQLAALHMARRMMDAFAGTRLVKELDLLLDRCTPARATIAEPCLELGGSLSASNPGQVQVIDAAMHSGKRIQFLYHAVGKQTPELRRVDPVALRYNHGHLYLIAYDPSRSGWRTFKIARLTHIAQLDEVADPHPDYDEKALFEYAANVWTGEPVQVAVRLTARVARFVHEWPLSAKQRVEPQPDGSVVIHAEVAGTVEAMRWVLRWGRDAEALQPTELREAVWAEIDMARSQYSSQRS